MLVQISGCTLHWPQVKHVTACEVYDTVVATKAMVETALGRRRKRMKSIVIPAPKQPYAKPTLTKHKPLRGITAGQPRSL